ERFSQSVVLVWYINQQYLLIIYKSWLSYHVRELPHSLKALVLNV